MRYFSPRFCFVLALCLCFVGVASATPISAGTYTLSGVTVNGAALNGTITLGSDGLATSASLSYANVAYSNPTFSSINSKGVSGNNPVANFAYIGGSNGQVALYYLQTQNSFGGISLCEAGSNCAQDSYLQIYSPNLNAKLVGGSLAAAATPVAVTPEPSAPVLMLTGAFMIGAVVVLRRSRQAVPSA